MTEFNAGEEFFYYGNDKTKHGNLGKVTKIHSDNPTEYECMVEWAPGPQGRGPLGAIASRTGLSNRSTRLCRRDDLAR